MFLGEVAALLQVEVLDEGDQLVLVCGEATRDIKFDQSVILGDSGVPAVGRAFGESLIDTITDRGADRPAWLIEYE